MVAAVMAVAAAAAGDAGVDHDPRDRFVHGIRIAPPGRGLERVHASEYSSRLGRHPDRPADARRRGRVEKLSQAARCLD